MVWIRAEAGRFSPLDKVVLQMMQAGIGDPETLLTKEPSHQWRRESEEIPGLLNRRQHDLLSCRSMGPNKTAAASVANYPLPELKGGDFDHFDVDLSGNRLFLNGRREQCCRGV